MQPNLYDSLYKHERTYWWSVSRRKLCIKLWEHFSSNATKYSKLKLRALDAGCGTGGMLEELESMQCFEDVVGIDISKIAIEYCIKGGGVSG